MHYCFCHTSWSLLYYIQPPPLWTPTCCILYGICGVLHLLRGFISRAIFKGGGTIHIYIYIYSRYNLSIFGSQHTKQYVSNVRSPHSFAQMLLHSSGYKTWTIAKSYKTKNPGVLHDAVVHAKKRVQKRNGSVKWRATSICSYSLLQVAERTIAPSQSWHTTRGQGFPIIKDWLKLNHHVLAGTKALRAQIRSAQYEHRLRGALP